LEEGLPNKAIPQERHRFYKKWLRYYLDFCHKYGFPDSQREDLPAVLGKLEGKRQTKAQREQAAYTNALYYEILDGKGSTERLPPQSKSSAKGDAPFNGAKPLSHASRQRQSKNAWTTAL
jgi:hypothetical protein